MAGFSKQHQKGMKHINDCASLRRTVNSARRTGLCPVCKERPAISVTCGHALCTSIFVIGRVPKHYAHLWASAPDSFKERNERAMQRSQQDIDTDAAFAAASLAVEENE